MKNNIFIAFALFAGWGTLIPAAAADLDISVKQAQIVAALTPGEENPSPYSLKNPQDLDIADGSFISTAEAQGLLLRALDELKKTNSDLCTFEEKTELLGLLRKTITDPVNAKPIFRTSSDSMINQWSKTMEHLATSIYNGMPIDRRELDKYIALFKDLVLIESNLFQLYNSYSDTLVRCGAHSYKFSDPEIEERHKSYTKRLYQGHKDLSLIRLEQIIFPPMPDIIKHRLIEMIGYYSTRDTHLIRLRELLAGTRTPQTFPLEEQEIKLFRIMNVCDPNVLPQLETLLLLYIDALQKFDTENSKNVDLITSKFRESEIRKGTSYELITQGMNQIEKEFATKRSKARKHLGDIRDGLIKFLIENS